MSTKIRPSLTNPELVKFVAEFGALRQKYTVKELASMLGITRQSLQSHIDKSKEAYK